jgi:hypothetical protein
MDTSLKGTFEMLIDNQQLHLHPVLVAALTRSSLGAEPGCYPENFKSSWTSCVDTQNSYEGDFDWDYDL